MSLHQRVRSVRQLRHRDRPVVLVEPQLHQLSLSTTEYRIENLSDIHHQYFRYQSLLLDLVVEELLNQRHYPHHRRDLQERPLEGGASSSFGQQ